MKKNDTSKTKADSKTAKGAMPKKAAQPYEIGELDQ